MKKGFVRLFSITSIAITFFVILYFALSMILLSNDVYAAELVCGRSPDSTIGYGQVILGNFTISCNNNADGLCPEDYIDPTTGIAGNCTNCVDPDCTGILSGSVSDYTGAKVQQANITTHPIRWNASSASLENSIWSNTGGNYLMQVATGRYYVDAHKDGFDTQVREVTVLRRKVSNLDFNLQNGTCHDDCTNSYGRCSTACDGVETSTGTCNFNPLVKSYCNNKLAGTEVLISVINTTHAYFASCCEGNPTPKYYSKAIGNTTVIKDLVTISKIATYNGAPVNVVIAYWNPVNNN